MRIATNETWKDKDTGEKKEKAEFHRVVFFGRSAEVLGDHAQKGGSLYVEGKISTRKWTDKEGNDRYTTEVIGDRFQFLGGGSRGESAEEAPAKSAAATSAAAKQYRDAKNGTAPASGKGGSFDDMESDIPF